MNHDYYEGKKLKELVVDAPKYAIGFYMVQHDGRYKHLSDVLDNEDCLNKTIKSISDLTSDYSYWIKLE